MVQIGKKIIYRDQVCTVQATLPNYKNDEDYYVFVSDYDPSLQITVPVRIAQDIMRPLISERQIAELMEKIPTIEAISLDNWSRGAEYKDLIDDGSYENILRIVKTTHLRQQDKIERHKRPSENDKWHFRRAEHLFYSEIAAALNMTYSEAKLYITQQVSALTA